MPLGIDRSQFFADKAKDTEKKLRARDERVASLETENAMLYLKLAQLRGQLQSSRTDANAAEDASDKHRAFRTHVMTRTGELRREVQSLKSELASVRGLAREMPRQMSHSMQRANSVLQHHDSMMQSQSSNITVLADQLSQLQVALTEMTDRHTREKKRRQELHNLLMELRGNIRVHCRVRPLMEFDSGNEDPSSLGRHGSKSEVVVHPVDDENVCVRTHKQNKVFEYERVYNPEEKQEAVFDEVQPMLTSLLDGYNICIMAYGQTGSGKTHTMLGSHRNDDYNPSQEPHRDEGVIPRATRELFRLIEEKAPGSHSVEVSVVEIYNNDIRDLLSKDPNAKHDVVTGADGSLNFPTVICKAVDTVYDVMCLVQHGLRTRRESATMVHEHSSRSHLVVTLTVISQAPSFFSLPRAPSTEALNVDGLKKGRGAATLTHSQTWSGEQMQSMLQQSATPPATTPTTPTVRTKLQLVDLAGSECVGMSGVRGVALREASYINKSLSALADVLGALAEHRGHVPYRNSRLTHFLQDSIGGDAKLLVLLCVSPAQRYITESLQCLGFGQRARQVQRGPTKRRLPSSAEKVDSSQNPQHRRASSAASPSR
ncbi:kinesin-like protein KIF25 [Babylonia areolata]|uniref:kinesin-like protein KIF25 n=1 Tax=Babylonia areolata TaxID=304850 RepID=UPI003FD2FE38